MQRPRRGVHQSLMDALDLLRYQRGRWADTNGPGSTPGAHVWRALADDMDTALGILTSLRDVARTEQVRLENLNGDDRFD